MFIQVNMGKPKKEKTELIKLKISTKKKLDKLKVHKRQNYDEVINDLLKSTPKPK